MIKGSRCLCIFLNIKAFFLTYTFGPALYNPVAVGQVVSFAEIIYPGVKYPLVIAFGQRIGQNVFSTLPI